MRRLPCLLILLALCAGGAEARPYKAPRTPFGTPDFQGIWTNSSVTFLQRPAMFKTLVISEAEAKMLEGGFAKMVAPLISPEPIDPNGPPPPVIKSVDNADFLEMDMHVAKVRGERRSSWIVDPADGRVPFTEAGRELTKQRERGGRYSDPEVRPNEERCLTAIGSPEGPPMMNTGFNGHYQFIQTRDHVAIQIEMNHDVRIIRITDRTHLPAAIQPWMGDSVGWWDGETLVVETTNLNPRGAYVGSLGGGFAYTAGAKIIERFTRTAADEMIYEFVVEDPVSFTQQWRGEMPMRPAKGPIYEYACHEGNYSLGNILAGARAQEREAATAKAAKGP